MLEVTQHRLVGAPAEQVWPDIAEGHRFAEWYAFCDVVETPQPGTRVLKGSWGGRQSTVTTEVTAEDPPRRYAWRHVAETLDDQPAPSLAMDTTVEILLQPVDGGTEVTITSRQQAAGWWQALLIRLLGRRQITNMLQQSLTLLAARHTPPG